jgi:hypothetical protein
MSAPIKRILIALFGAFGATALLSGCSFNSNDFSGMGFPKNVSSVNDISLSLWQGSWIAAAVVGVITLILIMWPAVFHRKNDAKKGEFPKPIKIGRSSFWTIEQVQAYLRERMGQSTN